jgi:hypothetical protein
MATSWRLARALDVYRAELAARWPNRDRRSDGGIGDAEHAARSSDHNPWLKSDGMGIVRAWDTDKDLTGPATDPQSASAATEANWLAEHLRSLGKAGDPRLVGGGYVIWNRRIAGEVGDWAWRPYDGQNSHEHHVHLSVSRNASGFDSTIPWGIWPPVPSPLEDDVLKDQTVINPISKQPETLDVTIAYLEQRVVDSLLEKLPAAIWNYMIVNPVAGAKETASTALSYLESRITGRPVKK